MLFRKPSRPFDPTGKSVLNLIIGEERSFPLAEDRIFIPSHGPYYTGSVVAKSGGVILQRGVDYECILLHMEATKATAKEVGVAIKLLDPTLQLVSFDYQVVGGKYQDVTSVLSDLLTNMGNELVHPIRWSDIVGKPEMFNPAAHRHPFWEFVGWDQLITPLDRVLNGIYYQDRKKYRDTYDYFYAKLGQFKTFLEQATTSLSTEIASNYLFFRDPINTVRIKTVAANPSLSRDGAWVEIVNKVVGFSETPALLGNTITLSAETVYPQPDNIILNESDVPILQDNDEWIYQDNEYPIYPGVVENYTEVIDEQFDLLYVKGYVKTSHGSGYSASVSSSKSTLVEGDTTSVVLTTFKYAPGLRVPYAIEGVGSENITIPKYGYVNLGLNGNASITFSLKANSPRTDSSALTVEFAINGGVSITLPYTLNSNLTYSALITAVDGLNDVVQGSHIVGDTFYVRISQHGLSGKTVRLTGLFGGVGNHQLYFNNTLANGNNGGYVDIMMPSNGGDLFVPVRSVQVGADEVTTLNLSVSYNSTVLSNYTLPAALMAMEVFWINAETGQQITTFSDDRPFRLVVKHNSTQGLVFNVEVVESTVIGEITPSIPSMLYSNLTGDVESNSFIVNRNDRTLSDIITVRVTSPLEPSINVSATLTFQPG